MGRLDICLGDAWLRWIAKQRKCRYSSRAWATAVIRKHFLISYL